MSLACSVSHRIESVSSCSPPLDISTPVPIQDNYLLLRLREEAYIGVSVCALRANVFLIPAHFAYNFFPKLGLSVSDRQPQLFVEVHMKTPIK